MATQVDPLRSTLDHLALDPRARSDRPYLITMLRRLGYSEAEIAAYLGEAPPKEAAPEPEPEVEHAPVLDEHGERIIEIEYTGPGLRDFQLVVPMDATEFDVDDPLGLGAGLEAGTMTIEGDPDEDELSSFLDGEGAVSLDDEFAGDEDEFEAEADRDNEETNVRGDEDEDEFMSVPDDDDDQTMSFGGEAAEDDDFDPGMDENDPFGMADEPLGDDASESFDPETESLDEHGHDDADAQDDGSGPVKGKKVVQFTGVALHSGKIRRLEHSPEGEDPGESEALHAGPADEWQTPQGSEDAWPQEATDDWSQGHVHGDWLLHSREEQREDGSWHTVYFFAKGRSQNGEPAPLPEGFHVAEDPEGLPYLEADGHEGEEPRKRVRMKRVSAQSREEAEELLRQDGRNVLGSMPIDINEHEEDGP